MNNSTMLSMQIAEAFEWLDQVMVDLTPEQYAWQPEGSANPISKLHAHTLSSADFWLNLMALGKSMMWMEVSQKTGLPSNWIEIWSTDVPIKLDRHAGVLAEAPRGRPPRRRSTRPTPTSSAS